jgi:hypothetical protein
MSCFAPAERPSTSRAQTGGAIANARGAVGICDASYPSESLPRALRAHRPVATSQKPELQSVFTAQEAPSGLPASPERVHRPVARLQMPELQSVFVAHAAPSGACANADAF